MSKYRAGIIGLGFAGGGDHESGEKIGQKVENLDGHHRSAYSGCDRIELAAGCDLDPGRRERYTSRTGARTWTDWRAMLDEAKLDIVSVATSSPGHAEIVLGCVERGVKVVWCEKPLATSPAEGDRMLAACRAAGTLLVVNHNRRFHPHYRRLRDLFAAGELGELTGAIVRWGTGRLGCVGTHLFDAALMITGRVPVALSAQIDETPYVDCRGTDFSDPGGWGLVRLAGGPMLVVSGANAARGGAELVVDGTRGRAWTGGDTVEIRRFDGTSETWPGVRQEATSMDRGIREIVAWLDRGGGLDGTIAAETTAAAALSALELVVGFHVSHARGGAWIDLPLTGTDRDRRVLAG